MAVRPASRPAAPFVPSSAGDIDQRFAAVAQELNRKANAGQANTAVNFIGLIAPDGSTWRLSVDVTGAVVTEQVPRL